MIYHDQTLCVWYLLALRRQEFWCPSLSFELAKFRVQAKRGVRVARDGDRDDKAWRVFKNSTGSGVFARHHTWPRYRQSL